MKNKKKSMKTRKSMKINKPQVPDFNFNGSETLTLLRRWQDISDPVYILIDLNHVPDHWVCSVVFYFINWQKQFTCSIVSMSNKIHSTFIVFNDINQGWIFKRHKEELLCQTPTKTLILQLLWPHWWYGSNLATPFFLFFEESFDWLHLKLRRKSESIICIVYKVLSFLNNHDNGLTTVNIIKY